MGLNIDENLSFNAQIDHLKKKLSHLSGVSYRLRQYFNLKAAKNFYYSCVYSLITYCITVYGGSLTNGRGNRLIRMHERIVKNLFSAYYPNECPFKRNKLLKLSDIYKFYAGIQMFKAINLNESHTVSNILNLVTAPHDYETRGRNDYRTPFPRVEAVRRSYKYQFVCIWNDLPEEIKSSSSLSIFKRKSSEFYLASY